MEHLLHRALLPLPLRPRPWFRLILLVGGGSSQGTLSVGPGVAEALRSYAVYCVMVWTSLLATVGQPLLSL